jgi:hypothetical protein
MTFGPNNLPDDAAALREMLLSTQKTLQNTQQALLGTMAQLDATRACPVRHVDSELPRISRRAPRTAEP